MKTLAERLQHSEPCGPLSAAELDAVLAWLSGRDHAGESLINTLGPADTDPALRLQVFNHLDRELFRNGQLDLHRAHVHRQLDEPSRRTRFRRLATAFHTDRHSDQDLIDWLTPRSQAIVMAYSAFRRGDLDTQAKALSPIPEDWLKDIDGRSSAELRPRTTPRWMKRLGNIPNLHIKLPAGLAVVVLLPLVGLLLLDEGVQEEGVQVAGFGVQEERVREEVRLAAIPETRNPNPETLNPETRNPPPETLPPETTPPTPHVVEPGDTLFSIARQRDMAWQDVAEINLIDQPETLEAGQLLWFRSLLPLALTFDTPTADTIEDAARPQLASTHPETLNPQPETLTPETRNPPPDPMGPIAAFHTAITTAALPTLLTTLSAAPRENQNVGRDWFRVSYGTLFRSSLRREVEFVPISVVGAAPRWQVMGQLQLNIDFADRDSVAMTRITRYVVIEDALGGLRIEAIDY